MFIILRTVIIYFVVLLALRLMGKRELAQLSPFDFVVAIIIAELAALPMEQKNIPLWEAFLPIGVVVVLEIGLSYLALKSKHTRGWIYGSPTIVVAQGKILDGNMRKLRYNTNDLLAQLRDKGIFDVTDVEFAIMEVPGTLSVLPKARKRPVTPADLSLNPDEEDIPIPIILDGTVIEGSLIDLNKSPDWVKNFLRQENLKEHEVFLATYCKAKGLRIVSKKGEPLPPELAHMKY